MKSSSSSNVEMVSDPVMEVQNRPSTPEALIAIAGNARKNLLPEKSNNRYQQAYDAFVGWKQLQGASSNSERVLMAYFFELEKKYAASTLWSKYSMLKSTLMIHDQVDISSYGSLNAMLKNATKGYEAKQAKTFTESELQKFIETAPDIAWLDVKVVCAFGLLGACRTHELPSIRMEDIARYDDMYFVTVRRLNTKTKEKNNGFAITGTLLDYVRKYEKLRPGHATTDRFFLNYQKGKCTVQTIGKSKFYKMPRRIAEFLKLPDVDAYTGHSIRRSSVTVYANTGASIEALKRYSGHKSTKVCEMYIDNSIGYKRTTANAITAALNCTATSNSSDSFDKSATASMESNSFRFATDPPVRPSRTINNASFGSGGALDEFDPQYSSRMAGKSATASMESNSFRFATDPPVRPSRTINNASFGSGGALDEFDPQYSSRMVGESATASMESNSFRFATDPPVRPSRTINNASFGSGGALDEFDPQYSSRMAGKSATASMESNSFRFATDPPVRPSRTINNASFGSGGALDEFDPQYSSRMVGESATASMESNSFRFAIDPPVRPSRTINNAPFGSGGALDEFDPQYSSRMVGKSATASMESNSFRFATDPPVRPSRTINNASFGSGGALDEFDPQYSSRMVGKSATASMESNSFRFATDPPVRPSRTINNASFGSGGALDEFDPQYSSRMVGNSATASMESNSFRFATNPPVRPSRTINNASFGSGGALDEFDTQSLTSAGIASGMGVTPTAFVPDATDPLQLDADDDADRGDDSNDIAGSQISTQMSASTQSFLAQMDKRFAFYKCKKVTIKFGK